MDSSAIEEARGGTINIWLRYLAVVVLVGNSLGAAWNVVALGRTVLQGSFDGSAGLAALNLVLSVIAIALAASIAAPARQSVSTGAKALAIPNVLGCGLGVATGVTTFAALVGQSQIGLSADTVAMLAFGVQSVAQNTFFTACTLVLAILVLASRRSRA